MIYPGENNYLAVAMDEARHIEPLRALLEKGASAIPPSPQDPYIDPLTDTERTLLNTSLELAEQVGQVYDFALQKITTAASALCDAVERYVCPKRGDKTCLRSELLNTKDRLRQALKR